MGRRSGGKGVLASILIMFSVVLFLGSMFWLLNEMSSISGNTGDFFSTPMSGGEERTLNQTVAELQRSGVIVTKYTEEYSGGYVNVSHEAICSEALNLYRAYTATDFNGTEVLLVETSEMVIQWYPEDEN